MTEYEEKIWISTYSAVFAAIEKSMVRWSETQRAEHSASVANQAVRGLGKIYQKEYGCTKPSWLKLSGEK